VEFREHKNSSSEFLEPMDKVGKMTINGVKDNKKRPKRTKQVQGMHG
jgi:hypothetical protein